MEYFHGIIHGWYDHVNVVISCDANRVHACVHKSYIEPDVHQEYYIAPGGRCYKGTDIWADQLKSVQCPECDHWFKSSVAYEQHYNSVHVKYC